MAVCLQTVCFSEVKYQIQKSILNYFITHKTLADKCANQNYNVPHNIFKSQTYKVVKTSINIYKHRNTAFLNVFVKFLSHYP